MMTNPERRAMWGGCSGSLLGMMLGAVLSFLIVFLGFESARFVRESRRVPSSQEMPRELKFIQKLSRELDAAANIVFGLVAALVGAVVGAIAGGGIGARLAVRDEHASQQQPVETVPALAAEKPKR